MATSDDDDGMMMMMRACCSGRPLLHGTRTKSDMMVLLEREDGRYTAGDTVRGRVHIMLTQDVNVKGQPPPSTSL